MWQNKRYGFLPDFDTIFVLRKKLCQNIFI